MFYKVTTSNNPNNRKYFISEFDDKSSTIPIRSVVMRQNIFFRLTRVSKISRIPCEFLAAKLNCGLMTFEELISACDSKS